MHELLSKIELAKADGEAFNDLLGEYLPFIRQEAGRQTVLGIEYDERVSIGMQTFADCVWQYQPQRGNFLSYVTVCMRNRLIDEARRLARTTPSTVPLENEDEEGGVVSFQQQAAIRAHTQMQQRANLAEEIAMLSDELAAFRVRFDDLEKHCPKHTRLRNQCIWAAKALAENPEQSRRLAQSGRLPITWLSENFDIPVKTLEKFRKYLITITVILMGDYPGVREFLPLSETSKKKGIDP